MSELPTLFSEELCYVSISETHKEGCQMLRTLALAGACALASLVPSAAARASAFADISAIWQVNFDGLLLNNTTQPISGLTITPYGDATYADGVARNTLTLNRTLADGSATYTASASGGIRIQNTNIQHVGGAIELRIDASGGRPFLTGVDYPDVESVNATSEAFAAGFIDSIVQCSTSGNPGVCECVDGRCFLSDFSEMTQYVDIPALGDTLDLSFSSFISTSLTADPLPALPEPGSTLVLLMGIAGVFVSHLRLRPRT
jgi:hypothetical protein